MPDGVKIGDRVVMSVEVARGIIEGRYPWDETLTATLVEVRDQPDGRKELVFCVDCNREGPAPCFRHAATVPRV